MYNNQIKGEYVFGDDGLSFFFLVVIYAVKFFIDFVMASVGYDLLHVDSSIRGLIQIAVMAVTTLLAAILPALFLTRCKKFYIIVDFMYAVAMVLAGGGWMVPIAMGFLLLMAVVQHITIGIVERHKA